MACQKNESDMRAMTIAAESLQVANDVSRKINSAIIIHIQQTKGFMVCDNMGVFLVQIT
jgi:hypothetical protein